MSQNSILAILRWAHAHLFHLSEVSFINTDSRFVQPNEKPRQDNNDLVNELIRFPEVLLIDEKGQQLGVKSRDEALRYAELKNLDLLCVAPMAKPPVCKIINYGKFKFEQQKKLKEMKKNQKVVETKEVRLSPQTDIGDLKTKARAVEKWIKDGNKVKVTMRYRGRQLSHIDVGEDTLNKFLELVSEFTIVEKKPVLEGKFLMCYIAAKPNK